MFWSANYIVVRELNFLLKEENVTLRQVLEADDILQECKADNKALIQFLTKPEVLSELITLITEEPPRNVELASQYRHANIACEVLTSQLAMLSDRLSLDATQMNRLCDFINKDPPLNPLLASYFSKTVEMLLERSPKQDWYLYHIVCLRVLDFFKSRRDFLPNLLRHMSTSAIADTFKYFIRLDDLFKKTVMEWLDEHNFLESLIQIVCGTYVAEEFPPAVQASKPDPPGKGVQEHSEKADLTHADGSATQGGSDADGDKGTPSAEGGGASPPEGSAASRASASGRLAAVASANAAALLCDLILNGCAGDGSATRPRTSWSLVSRLQSESCVRSLLQGMFTSPAAARQHALVHGCHVLRALLAHMELLRLKPASGEEEPGNASEWNGRKGAPENASERNAVELAVAPHLPLLHHALLDRDTQQEGACEESASARVGMARVQVAALLARLALSDVEEVASTLLTLGTAGVVAELFFRFPWNNFLHAQLLALLRHALGNHAYRARYATHLLVECDLLTRLMDVYEENQNIKAGCPRAGYMGHVILALGVVARAPLAEDPLGAHPALAERWARFKEQELAPLLQQYETPLGGFYPSENLYEVENMADTVPDSYDYNGIAATANMDDLNDDGAADDGNEICGVAGIATESPDFIADGLDIDDQDKMAAAENSFLELASRKFVDDDMWEDSPSGEGEGEEAEGESAAAHDVLASFSPWESEGGEASSGGEGWAQFGDAFCAAPADPFAPPAHPPAHPPTQGDDLFDRNAQEFSPFWSYDQSNRTSDPGTQAELESSMRTLRLEGSLADKTMDEASSVELANNLLTAMSAMSPDAIANIVNANLPPDNHPLPPDNHSLPPDNHPLPPDNHPQPSDNHTLPPNTHSLPPDNHSSPPDNQSLPPDNQSLPPSNPLPPDNLTQPDNQSLPLDNQPLPSNNPTSTPDNQSLTSNNPASTPPDVTSRSADVTDDVSKEAGDR